MRMNEPRGQLAGSVLVLIGLVAAVLLRDVALPWVLGGDHRAHPPAWTTAKRNGAGEATPTVSLRSPAAP